MASSRFDSQTQKHFFCDFYLIMPFQLTQVPWWLIQMEGKRKQIGEQNMEEVEDRELTEEMRRTQIQPLEHNNQAYGSVRRLLKTTFSKQHLLSRVHYAAPLTQLSLCTSVQK